MNPIKILIPLIFMSMAVYGQTPCVNGNAGGYPCNQVDLLAHLTNNQLSPTTFAESNDIWGWTDPESGKEYALIGQTNGVVFIDVSTPTNPVIVGRLPSHTGNSSLWRDVKVFKNYAFVVADNNPGHGMQIFDLTRLRGLASAVEFDNDAHYSGVSSAHNVVINEATGFAYIVGARNGSNGCVAGGLHIVDINDPLNPVYAGCFDADGYTHDAQCVIYNGSDADYIGQEICFNSNGSTGGNGNTLTIASVEDKNNNFLISKSSYPKAGYAHQGWLTEDHRYFIMGDELDESGQGVKTRSLIWDVRNLDEPKLIGQYITQRNSIDHNLYIHDERIYQSNYTSGLVIVDGKRVSDANLRELGYFDSYPASNATTFDGSWSNYPFFESGIVILSDINNGFFVLQPKFEEIIVGHPNFETCAGTEPISVQVAEGLVVAQYQWQYLSDNNVFDLSENSNFVGTKTKELTISPGAEGIEEWKFRCKVTLDDQRVAYTYFTNIRTAQPQASFTTTTDGKLVSFTNTSVNAEIYSWDFGDGSEISTEENPVHEYAEVGTYEVSLAVTNNCGESIFESSVNLAVLSSDKINEEDIKLYPNPAQRQVNMEFPQVDLSDITVLNAQGKFVFGKKTGLENGSVSFNISSWQRGVYFIIYTSRSGEKGIKKLIKQ